MGQNVPSTLKGVMLFFCRSKCQIQCIFFGDFCCFKEVHFAVFVILSVLFRNGECLFLYSSNLGTIFVGVHRLAP
jgi:hypothetical protein